MKALVALVLLIITVPSFAAACREPDGKHWSTTEQLRSVKVTLYWTTVYEGSNTVCKVKYRDSEGGEHSFDVWGQPTINKSQDLVALVSCADDGCDKSLWVLDAARAKLLETHLPFSGQQIYLKVKWKPGVRTLIVDEELSHKSFVCKVNSKVTCKRGT